MSPTRRDFLAMLAGAAAAIAPALPVAAASPRRPIHLAAHLFLFDLDSLDELAGQLHLVVDGAQTAITVTCPGDKDLEHTWPRIESGDPAIAAFLSRLVSEIEAQNEALYGTQEERRRARAG